jgi:hypothetical protein
VRIAVAADLDQAELQFVDRQRLGGLFIEMLEGRGCQSGLRQVAGDPAVLAATADRDVECGLYLAQVFVERAAEVLQARVV